MIKNPAARALSLGVVTSAWCYVNPAGHLRPPGLWLVEIAIAASVVTFAVEARFGPRPPATVWLGSSLLFFIYTLGPLTNDYSASPVPTVVLAFLFGLIVAVCYALRRPWEPPKPTSK